MIRKTINIEEYKTILLEILKDVDSFCRDKNIKYFLVGGTLLGAIRHKGYIPWDDDIDIAFLRKDYEKFVHSYIPSKPYYKLLSLETDKKYIYPFAKIIDRRVELIEKISGSKPIGAYIDVFPLDNCPGDSFKEASKSIGRMLVLKWARNLKIIRFKKNRNFLKNMILLFGKILTLFVSTRRLTLMISKKAKKNMHKNAAYVAGLVNITYGYGELLSKDVFDETIDVEFEGATFMAPKKYDTLLSSYYGDYMKLPPIEQQVTHHDFVCWYKSFNEED